MNNIRATVQELAEHEASTLLRGLEFAADHGAYEAGDTVAIGFDPQWDAANQRLQVGIFFHAFENWLVDWNGRALILRSKEGDDYYARLDSEGRGQVELPASTYRAEGGLRGQVVVMKDVLPREKFVEIAASSAHEGYDEAWEHDLSDPLLRVHMRVGGGRTRITFKTENAAFAGATVEFGLFDPTSNKVELRSEVQLEKIHGEDSWQAAWLGPFRPSKDCNFWRDIRTLE